MRGAIRGRKPVRSSPRPVYAEDFTAHRGHHVKSDKGRDIDLGARVGHVNLRVSDLDRSIKFYAEVMGA